MKMKLTLCLLILSFCSTAQMLVDRPYLKIYDTYFGKTYKAKPKHIIAYSLEKDSVVIYTRAVAFDTIGMVLKDKTIIPYKDIHYLQTRTINKVKGPFKLVSYAGYIAFASIVIHSTAGCAECGGIYVGFIISTIALPFWVLGTEAVAGILQAFTPAHEFYRSEMILEYIPSNAE
jgi:hypothetical protein